jgi:hypothetical protein
MTANATTTANAINVFEIVRRVLGHLAVIPEEDVNRMFDVQRGGGGKKTVRTGLIRYALALVAAQEKYSGENLPDPIIPVVDVANLRVSHMTCTGRTEFGVESGRVSMTRSEPLDADSPRDISLWLLTDASSMASDRLFEHANVFGQDGKARGESAVDGSKLDQLRVLEGIAVLVEHGVTVKDACAMACKRGIKADPEKVLVEMEYRRLGLWLQDRPWCQDAWRVLNDTDQSCRYGDADIPEDVKAAKAAMRLAVNSGLRTRNILMAPAPTPAAHPPVADWERELIEGAEGA